jgi:predicted transcriptional regulator YheO
MIDDYQEYTFQTLCQIAKGIQRLFHPFCEVVIHDLSNLERSIIHIEGNITGRSVGGAATDLLLAQARNGNTTRDFYNYRTQLPNGKTMKSCTLFLRDEDGTAYGAFCVNLDVSLFEAMGRVMGDFIATEDDDLVSETLSDDIQKTVHSILMETIQEVGKTLPILSREDKVNLIGRLDDRGVFQVKKSVPILADELGLSRSTVYNYLSEARGERDSGQEDD